MSEKIELEIPEEFIESALKHNIGKTREEVIEFTKLYLQQVLIDFPTAFLLMKSGAETLASAVDEMLKRAKGKQAKHER